MAAYRFYRRLRISWTVYRSSLFYKSEMALHVFYLIYKRS